MSGEMSARAVRKLRSNHLGAVLLAGDEGYEASRHVWNGMIDRKPPLIARATGVADVIEALKAARENDLPVSIKGGGHSAAGTAVSDDALMVDLSLMKGVHVDPVARTAHVQGGATWGVFDRECQVHGLATTGGAVSTTGVAGLTLGGGIGWLMGSYGLTIDNLLSAQLVTADGEVLKASASENPDLFWALRGGGGNFGVVTSFEFRVHPVGPMVMGGSAAWSLTQGRQVLDFYHAYTQEVPDELTMNMSFAASPVGRSMIAGMGLLYSGSLDDAAPAVQPIKDFGPPLADLVRPLPYIDQQRMLDAGFPSGSNVYWKSTFLTGLSDDAKAKITEMGENLPTRMSTIIIEHLHGAVRRVAPDATAFQEREAEYNIILVGSWTDAADADRSIAWVRKCYDDLQPFSTGSVYVNYLGLGDNEERIPDAYGVNYERLLGIKQKYDPENVFRVNQNLRRKSSQIG